MASSINASTAGGGGIITTADATGNLDIQSGGSTVVAVTSAGASVTGTLAATGAVTLTGSLNTPNTFGFKNRIINGGMVIDQRNAGASVTPTVDGTYTLDRCRMDLSQASKFSVQQNAGAVTPPTGFTNYLGVTSSSAYSVLAGDYFDLAQNIEGFNVADLGWGTANAATVTLSFWVRSSLTGTFGGAFKNSAGTRSYPFTYSIPTANTWTSINVTVAGDTGGTWIGATNGIGLRLQIGLGVGSTYSGTSGVWATANYSSATGAVSVVGTSGATFYITGVQLEKGSTATSFDFRDYGRELIMCQRYCQKIIGEGVAPYVRYGAGFCYSTTAVTILINLLVSMRAAPSLTVTATPSNYAIYSGSAIVTNLSVVPSIDTGANNISNVGVTATVASGLTAGHGALLINNNNTTGFMLFTSEL